MIRASLHAVRFECKIPRLSTGCRALLVGMLAGALSGGAFCQPAYPSAPIKLVIGTPPGGSADSIGRIVGERLTAALGQPVLVENRGGAGGNIASQFVAKAPPDGYTLLLTANNHNLNARIYKDPGYDPRRDFVPVIQLSDGPSVLLTQPNSQLKTIRQVVDAAKAEPQKIPFERAVRRRFEFGAILDRDSRQPAQMRQALDRAAFRRDGHIPQPRRERPGVGPAEWIRNPRRALLGFLYRKQKRRRRRTPS